MEVFDDGGIWEELQKELRSDDRAVLIIGSALVAKSFSADE